MAKSCCLSVLNDTCFGDGSRSLPPATRELEPPVNPLQPPDPPVPPDPLVPPDPSNMRSLPHHSNLASPLLYLDLHLRPTASSTSICVIISTKARKQSIRLKSSSTVPIYRYSKMFATMTITTSLSASASLSASTKSFRSPLGSTTLSSLCRSLLPLMTLDPPKPPIPPDPPPLGYGLSLFPLKSTRSLCRFSIYLLFWSDLTLKAYSSMPVSLACHGFMRENNPPICSQKFTIVPSNSASIPAVDNTPAVDTALDSAPTSTPNLYMGQHHTMSSSIFYNKAPDSTPRTIRYIRLLATAFRCTHHLGSAFTICHIFSGPLESLICASPRLIICLQHLWKIRYPLLFENRVITEFEVVGKTLFKAQALQAQVGKVQVKLIAPTSLAPDLTTNNFSFHIAASWLNSSHTCKLDWYFVDPFGNDVSQGSTTHQSTSSALMVVGIAFKADVETASRLEIHHLRVFSDSHSLVSLIISNGDVNELKSVLHGILCLLETFSSIFVSFFSCTTNVRAYSPAKTALISVVTPAF